MPTTTTDAGAIRRHFTTPDVDPLDAVEWDVRPAWKPEDPHYRPEVEAPDFWSQTAVDISAKLYLAKGEYREDSVREMIERVVEKITVEGVAGGYFEGGQYDGRDDTFAAELGHILVNQLASFNSPVWFNIGRPDRKQCPSACFLVGVGDTSTSILDWTRSNAFIFKAGAGSGSNLSQLRGSMEPLSPGGIASGPVSFMRIDDAVAGTFKSGGVTRRAAKLVCLDDDHPDVRDFVNCKVEEEKRLHGLASLGYNISMDAEGERFVAETTAYQNANNSVRLSDAFMRKATGEDSDLAWPLIPRKKGVFGGDVTSIESAPQMLDEISQACHACADPGVQFHDTINSWHTTPADGPIRTTNPCGEVSIPDDSSCNLASINVLKFVREDGTFDVEGFEHVVDVMITAMDILCEFCELPTDLLTERTKRYRWLGLGYANMGAAVMSQGMPYDSDQARDFAGSITALMTGRAYRRSSELARDLDPFDGYAENSEAMLSVISRHKSRTGGLAAAPNTGEIWNSAKESWVEAIDLGMQHGYRNAQVTVIAPTGSISFLMDCDTTGIEPCWLLVTHKDLAGGGSMTLVNQSVERALHSLRYDSGVISRIMEYLAENGQLPTTAHLNGDAIMRNEDHNSIFDGANDISPEGHVRMVAAVQPFLSGSVSKTINVHGSTTWEEIRDLYVLAWRLGVKCMAIYRDGSKARQVLSSKPKKVEVISTTTVPAYSGPRPTRAHADEIELMVDPHSAPEDEISRAETPHAEDAMEGPVGPERRRMPRDASMLRHKFCIGGFEGYLMVGLYDDGTPGEIFLEDIGKEGSHVKGMTSAWAIQVSTALQYGQPLEVMIRKYTHMCFEPNGRTECPEIPTAQSLPDYIMRWMALKFVPEMHEELGILTPEIKRRKVAELDFREAFMKNGYVEVPSTNGSSPNGGASFEHGLVCTECGGMMQPTGGCYTCSKCASTTGCG